MKEIIRYSIEGLARIAFPNVCICCGMENTRRRRQVCSFCLHERFEDANPDNQLVSSDTLLPENIRFQHALWNFDKGGDLQHLLHRLKYHRLTHIGVDLGRRLGERLQSHPQISTILGEEEVGLLPVPLHYLKFRYRGFNQAFLIARGVQEVWPRMPICDIKQVVRTKNTRTQTGFSLEKRLRNIDGAFRVKDGSAVKSKFLVIVDDVFTTGATTFELARTLLKEGSSGVGICTVAQA